MLDRLSFRLALPVTLAVLLLGGCLALFVLGAISRFAQEHAEHDLQSYARETSAILDAAYDQLAASGRMADPDEVRAARGRALAALEKSVRANAITCLVLGPKEQILLQAGIADPAPLLAAAKAPGGVEDVPVGEDRYHVLRSAFPLWNLNVLLARKDADFPRLAAAVRDLYLGAGGLLVLALVAFLLFSHAVVSRPVRLIADDLLHGRRPSYRGIREFESLTRSIGAVMASLDERERLVRLSRTWYRQMFEAAPAMMFTTSRRGWFCDVNLAFIDHTGLGREHLLNAPLSEVLDVDPDLLQRLWEGEPLRRAPAQLRPASGPPRQALLDALVTEDPKGERVALFVAIDVTEERRARAELIAAKEAAEEASRAKSEFLANVSHEIRTPLNGVLGMLQLLEKSGLDQRRDDWVRNALDCGRSLLTLLGDILDLSSLESGSRQCRLEPFSAVDILREVAQLYVRQAQAKGITLAVEADPAIPRTLLGDGGRLRQALFNLAGNAVKFTPSGSVTLRADAVGRDRQGVSRLLFSVEDTGVGIEPAKLARVFEPFTQADGSHTRRYQGAGLGLAIVRRLVRLWEGSLEIDSQPGEGCTVSFTMPVSPAPRGAEPPLPAPAHPAQPRPGGRVLLAEDDPVNTVMTMDMLESLGYLATIVENGEEALKALAQEDFDCLIMDIQMPGMDGLTATRAIRRAPALGEKARIPIIALTAHALPGDRERFLAEGMDDYLPKPVEYDDLAVALHRAMGKPWRRLLS
ncbi:Autoinducer 2 sensor kinase/phosphatase LuxQ [Fundidesulfovibrio magnetotacticus]|uniref:histidine kinase n=1 Tax=Fundidesulfovibrio magnetotacticus TaxID=2730080 RepID=A0A6V8LXL1_9BACT|nr:ATP-binding protein [Fundidesulfovibrio magnetotacticus]GFK94799.1 Autoinducer 2 sensor kinase/phosphatase LuxQ [Fundidesulfovibrio magnetotacticus]